MVVIRSLLPIVAQQLLRSRDFMIIFSPEILFLVLSLPGLYKKNFLNELLVLNSN